MNKDRIKIIVLKRGIFMEVAKNNNSISIGNKKKKKKNCIVWSIDLFISLDLSVLFVHIRMNKNFSTRMPNGKLRWIIDWYRIMNRSPILHRIETSDRGNR